MAQENGDWLGLKTLVFLAGARVSHVNGEEIVVDGGLRRSLMGHIPRPGY
ncbi:hypothetical protein [Xanthobacter oligotrophicus]|nr:hypothetical protein [Xanthobacter oligotrophicus]MCG5235340.1 hypothetical protein [Xanthobacter oligotrophicus]